MAASRSRRRDWKRLLRLWRLGPASGTAGAMKYITTYPGDYAAWLIYADCKWSTARYDKATWALRRAQHFAPRHVRPRLHEQWGLLYEEKNDLKRAEAWFRRALRAIRSPRRYVALGRILRKQGKLTKAEQMLRRALGASRTFDADYRDEVHFQFGLVLLALARHAEAARHFSAALRIDPRHRLAKDALDDVRTALAPPALGSSRTQAWRQLLRRWKAAAPATAAASAMNYTDAYPDDYRGWIVLADGMGEMNRYDVARQSLRRAQRVVPRRCRHNLYKWWGFFYRDKQDLKRAEWWFRRALSARPTTRHYTALGATLAKQGRLTEAERVHRRAIAVRTPGDPVDEAHLNLGFVLRARSRNAEAARHFRAAIRLDPRDTKAKQALRDVLQARVEHAALRRLFESRQKPDSRQG